MALSFASASLVGGASYLFPDRFNILLWGSSAAAITAGIVTSVFTRRFTNTIAQANNTIDRLSNGQSSNWGDQQLDELELLGANLSQLSGQLQVLTKEQDKINQQRQLISSLTFRTRRTANLDVLMQTAVDGARDVLDTDRVVVYRFNDDWSGTMIAESVAEGFPKALNETIGDPCFRDRHVAQYQSR